MRVTRLCGRPWVGAFATLLFALTPAACTSLLGDFNNGTNPDASADGSSPSNGPDATTMPDAPTGNNDSGAALGAACNAGSQCGSGFCADGVCCNNACAGTCESCNQGGAKSGTCSPIAAMTDPEKECVMIAPPVVDAGAVDSGSEAGGGDAAVVDAGDAAPAEGGTTSEAGTGDAAAGDAATTDAAPVEAGPSLGYNPPDGGVTTNMSKCAGSCDGKGGNGGGSCVYPDSTTICGTQFCNTSTQKGAFVCDSAGHCGLSLNDCTDYSCSTSTGTCGTSCSTQADCLPTDYCDGLNCHAKRGTGVPCTAPSQCTSGFCDDMVCCETDCSKTTGGNCDLNGTQAGTCSCSQCSTGPCAVYYYDGDSDGYGDPTVTTVACASATPAHYVTNNLDCDDGDARVNPAQTAYFSTPSKVKGTFDYNCDGTLEKGIPEYPSYYNTGSCGFCSSVQSTAPACYVSSTSCTSTGAQSTLGCQEYFGRIILASETTPRITADAVPIVCPSCFLSYCGASPTPDPNWQNYPGSGFAGSPGCGTNGTFIDCGTCGGSTGSPSTASFTVTQTCH